MPGQAGAAYCQVPQAAQACQRRQVSIAQAAAANQGQLLQLGAPAGQPLQQAPAQEAAIQHGGAQAAARRFEQRRKRLGCRAVATAGSGTGASGAPAARAPAQALHVADVQVPQAVQQRAPLAAGGTCEPQQRWGRQRAAAADAQLVQAVGGAPALVRPWCLERPQAGVAQAATAGKVKGYGSRGAAAQCAQHYL